MKNLKISLVFLFAVALILPLHAQDKGKKKEEKKVIIKTKDENGKVTTEEIILDGDEMEGEDVRVIVDDKGERRVIIQTDGDKKGKKKVEKEVRVMVIDGDEEMPEDIDKMLEEMDIDIEIDDREGAVEKKRVRIISIDDDGNKEEIEWEGEGDFPEDIQKRLDEKGIDITEIEKEKEHRIIMKHGGDKDSGFLGVMLRKEVNNDNGVETVTGESEAGVVVDDVVEGSAAEKAKLQADDVITAIDGKKVTTIDELTGILGDKKANETVKINYTRGGKAMETSATLQERTTSKMLNTWTDDEGNTIELDDDMEIEFIEEGEGAKKVIKKKKVIIIEEEGEKKSKKKKKD